MKKLLGLLSAVLIISFTLNCTISSASYVRYYGIAQNSSTGKTGGFFLATTKALDSKWSSTNDTRFILHTIWVTTNTSTGSWIECGYMDGAIDPGTGIVYHKGFYTARGIVDSNNNLDYSEYKITGPSTAIDTTHTYQIQRDGIDTWGVYVDYTLRKTFSAGSTIAYMNCGLETNYTGSSSETWNEKSFQLLSNGTWSDWTSGTLNNTDTHSTISRAWDTQYTSIKTSKTSS